MSSVWKRIQRVGKRASKFQFIASYQALTLECSRDGKWQPNKLSVVWTRRNRRKAVKGESWQPSISNPFRGMIVWTDPEEVEISVTLYKDAREGSPFEDKLWTFVIEDESVSGKRRPVASVYVNMVDYHSVDLQTFCLNLPLRPASKKVISASLELNLACVLLKEGNATDEDMISMSSLLSLSDPYGSRDSDFDHPPGKNFKRNAGKRLSLRSNKSKNKPTFNMASSKGSPKEPKKNTKSKGKSLKNEKLNSSSPVTNHVNNNGLNKMLSTSDTDLSRVEITASPKLEKKEEKMSAPEQSLLKWCQECVAGYANVELINMTTSWRNGLAFCAIINHFNPEMIDFSNLKPEDVRENNRLAFEAFDYLGISRMLDPHQMVLSSVPDKLLIMTYLHQIKQYFTTRKKARKDHTGYDDDVTMESIDEADRSLRLNTETPLNDIENNDFSKVKARSREVDTSKVYVGEVEYEASRPGYNPFDDDGAIAEDDVEIGFPSNSLEDENINSKSIDIIYSKENTPSDNFLRDNRNSDNISQKSHSDSSQKIDKIEHENLPENKDKISRYSMQEDSKNQINDLSKEAEKAGEDPWKPGNDVSLRRKNKIAKIEDTARRKPEKLDIPENNTLPESVLYSPKPGYNPFLDEETDGVDSNNDHVQTPKADKVFLEKEKSTDLVVEKAKSLNPFDEDYVDDDISDTNSSMNVKSNKSLNPFDDDYEEPFETDLNKVLSETVVAKVASFADNGMDLGTVDVSKAMETNDSNKGHDVTDIDEVLVGNASPRSHSNRLQTKIENRHDNKEPGRDESLHNSGSAGRSSEALPKTSHSRNVTSVPVKSTENLQISQMHRKEPRRSGQEQSTLVEKPLIRKQLTEGPIKMKRPDSENLGRKKNPTSPTPASVQLSLPTSPRSRIPSFEEWKAKKSDDAAKQEKIKAQARLMIKEARSKTAISQNREQESQVQPVSARDPGAASTSLPRLQSSKKYKAPEPPGLARQTSLAAKLKDEIEFQKKITEKTRKTLEASRIKRINPKQENEPVVEKKSERSEKVQRAIMEARERPRRKPPDPPENSNDMSKGTLEVSVPPKPPRVYTYSEEPVSQPLVRPEETEFDTPDSEKTGTDIEADENVDSQSTELDDENEPNSSLQQNPFKLTFKRKDLLPQAVVKPVFSNIGRDTKIDLKKYSANSRKLSKSQNENNRSRSSEHLTSSQESLSEHGHSSEEDVNDILDNVGDVSDSENKSEDELYGYGEDEEGFQDTSQYVEHEIAVLEEDRVALDRVAVKLEKELREAMNTEDCKEEEQRLFQEWFLLVNKRNEIVRRQTELSILEKEEDLEKRFELLNRELRFLMNGSNQEKSAQEKKREELLLAELVRLVNKRDELVRIEDSQVQEAEKAAQHVEHIVRNTKIPKKQADCCIQ